MTFKAQLLLFAQHLINEYEKEEKSGILFKLEKGKDLTEIFGVLDFLKYKLEKWGNTNIFSYLGCLFNDNIILIIGANNTNEAASIIKHIYISQVIKTNEVSNEVIRFLEKSEDKNNFEDFLNKEISNNLNVGCSVDPKFEVKLKDHLKNLLKS